MAKKKAPQKSAKNPKKLVPQTNNNKRSKVTPSKKNTPPLKQKYISTPEKMYEYFIAYSKEVKSNPFIVKDWIGKDALQVEREKERPLTMEGFECYCSTKGIINDLSDYFANKGGSYNAYSAICSRIRKEIRDDQISGGMAGIYNPSITQRLNGLVDKQETKVVSEQPLLPD